MEGFLLGGVKALLALQAVYGTVAGTVRNGDTNQPIAGLVVTLTDLRRSTLTDSLGKYVFREVSPGLHHMAVRYLGFAPRTVNALVPADGALEINVSLVPVETRLPALVVRQSAGVRTVGNDDARSISSRRNTIAAIRDNPMFTEPDVLQSLAGGDVVVRPESPGGLHIRGGASDHVAYALDGIPVFSPYHSAGIFSAWNPDAMSAVELSSSMRSPGDAGSLSGTVAAESRAPSARLNSQGTFSSTQARVTLDGPLGAGGAGFLVALRTGLPGLAAPVHDESYLRGGSGDRIIKLETPAFGGRLRLLRYDSEDEVNTAATADDAPPAGLTRNAFDWSSRSIGAEWNRASERAEIRALVWRASADAGASWSAFDGPLTMASGRRDDGASLVGRRVSARSTTTAGVRVERSLTRYLIDFQRDSASDAALGGRTLVTTGFAQRESRIGAHATLTAGVSLAHFNGTLYASPGAELRWQASRHVVLSGSYARQHQFAQSLRNAESATDNIFPADLFIGAGNSSVPVARSDQAELAAEVRPSSAVRFAAHAYDRRLRGLVLVAPFDGEPFATHSFGVGDADSRGVSVEGEARSSRLVVAASYGLQQVMYASRGSSYVPNNGATHVFQGGATLFPTPTFSLRFGVTGESGRRGTNVVGPFGWEACNLRDRGCEFSGSPRTDVAALGTSRLPLYARADIGFRKQWRPTIGDRDVGVALFGTLTNVFGRRNLLTFARNPVTGALTPIEMRRFAPLVVGLDWTF